jgi:hypothetical protein
MGNMEVGAWVGREEWIICFSLPLQEFYPHKDEQKLLELVETFELMATVVEFQQQVNLPKS